MDTQGQTQMSLEVQGYCRSLLKPPFAGIAWWPKAWWIVGLSPSSWLPSRPTMSSVSLYGWPGWWVGRH